jgi:cyanophycinase
MYKKVFNRLGCENVGIMNVRDRIDANAYQFIKRAEEADAILFTGGDQFKLTTMLGSSRVLEVLHKKYYEGNFVIAGTSAGAMAAPIITLYEGHQKNALLNGDVKTSAGLGFIYNCIFDTHFINRGRFGRLTQAVVTNPTCIGVGLAEDTAMVIRKGNEMECIGSGMVIIIDGREIKHTNIAHVPVNSPIYIENLKVHVLTKGNGYLLNERHFVEDVSIFKKQT